MRRFFGPALKGAVLFLVLAGFSDNRADYDTFIYLNFGREFWTGQGFLRHDIFSYLPTFDKWVFHEWLSGVVFYAIFKAFGTAGLQMWKILLGLATVGIAWVGSTRRGGGRIASIMVILGAGCLFYPSFGTIRAQVFTFLFLVITLVILEEVRSRGRLGAGLVLVPMFCLWANVHGGFLAGVGAVAVYGAAALAQKKPVCPFIVLFLAGGLATLINPYGLALWHSVLFHSAAPDPRIMEWFSIPHSISVGINLWGSYAYMTAGVLTAFLFAFRLKRDLAPVLILSAFYVMGVMHVRHMALFVLALSVYGGAALSDFWKASTPKMRLVPVLVGLAYLPFAFIIYFQQGYWLIHPKNNGSPLRMSLPPCEDSDTAPPRYPVGFVEYAKKAGLSGKLAAPYSWGAFLSFMLGDKIRVSLDGRCETVFPDDVREISFRFSGGYDGWREFLRHWPPDMILVQKGTLMHRNVESTPGWKMSWQDSGCALYVEDGLSPKDFEGLLKNGATPYGF